MNINIEKALKYQFTDKNWFKKTAIHLVYPYTYMLLGILAYVGMIFSSMLVYLDMETVLIFLFVLAIFVSIVGGLLGIFYSFFLSGYLIEIVRKAMKGEAILPEISPVGARIKEGFKASLIGLVPFSIIMVLVVVIAILYIVLVDSEVLSESLSIVLTIIFFFTIFISYLLGFIYNIIVSPAMLFLYIKKGLKSAFSPSLIIKVIKTGWIDFLLYYGLSMAGAFAFMILMYIPILGQLAYPFIMVIYFFIMANLQGQIMGEVDEKIKL